MIGDKFKPGDIIHDKEDRTYRLIVLKIAKKGEIVRGTWYDGSSQKEIPNDCYVLEGYNSKILFLMGFDLEEFYEIVQDMYKDDVIDRNKYPNDCPYCEKPCYKGGMNNIKCSNPKCFCYDG